MKEKLVSNRFFYLLGFQFLCLAVFAILGKSEEGNNFIFGYSFQRIILIIGLLLPTIYFIYGIAISIYQDEKFINIDRIFKAIILSPLASILIEISLIIFVAILSSVLVSYLFYRMEVEIYFYSLPYVFKLIQPYLYFYLLICIQIRSFKNKERSNKDSKNNTFNQAIPYLIIIFIFFLTTFFSYRLYTNPHQSIATSDTRAYIKASQIDFLNLDFFSSNRPATISGYFKMLEPKSGYNLDEIALTSENSKNRVGFQPGFDRITWGQSILSGFSWLFLALTIANFIKTPLLKIFGGITITLFSMVPQVTDWNNVLQSESLSISLFVITFSLAFQWVNRLVKYPESNNIKNILITILFILSLTLWVFSRDSNSYFLYGLALFLIISFLIPSIRKLLPTKLLIATILSVSIIFLFFNSTFNRSDRWVNPIMNNIKVFILPYEDQIELFKSYGMPADDDVLKLPRDLSEGSYKEHEDLYDWLVSDGLNSYKKFLMQTPKHTVSLPLNNLERVFSENIQPYYINRDVPDIILNLGNFLHQMSPRILVFEILLLIFLLIIVLKKPNKESTSIFFVLSLFFINTLLMYVATVHGDASSIIRHSLVSILPFRLYFWVTLIIFIDTLLISNFRKIHR